MDDRVVVGYDTSPESATAVRWAATQAADRGWALDVVHVWGFAGRDGGGAGDSWLGRQVQQQVREVAEEGARLATETAPGIDARPVVLHGPPAAVLAEHAADARLAVVGRRGAGTVRAALLGSVTTGVLHRAACPVAVVPPGTRLGGAPGPVLVGFDGSAGAYDALQAGCDQAARLGTDVSVLVAWSAAAAVLGPGGWALGYAPESPVEAALAAAERVRERARSWAAVRHDVTVTCELVEGQAARALVDRSRGASLVVVGTRGLGGLSSLVLGSTSRPVVQRAACPVLVTRTQRDLAAGATTRPTRETAPV